MRTDPRIWTALALALLRGSAAGARDMAGVELGMTMDEVEAVIRGWGDPPRQAKRLERKLKYSNGVQTFSTEPFVDRLMVLGQIGQSTYHYHFAPASIGGGLIHIQRQTAYGTAKGASASGFRDSLTDKYGPETQDASHGSVQSLVWADDPGKSNCLSVRKRMIEGTRVSVGDVSPSSLPGILARLGVAPETCGTWLYYEVSGDPVVADRAILLDVAAVVAADRAISEWLEGLEAQARDDLRRASEATKPEL